MRQWPKVVYKEECMREGMQIEDVNIPVEQKVRLLDAISETGLKNIVVGSFVSPKYTPQMASIDEILRRFRPKPGVTYTALVANRQGEERARADAPPLTLEREPVPYLSCTLCDVFVRRNFNRSQAQEIERWPQTIARAKERKLKAAGIAIHAAWGSNFLGPFTLAQRIEMLEGEHALWDDVGIAVTHVNLGDPMSWNAPHDVEETLAVIKKRWPSIKHFKLHFHNARGMAMASTYAALRVLEATDTVYFDGTIGGIGGCPYCGNGRATGMVATEDLMHFLQRMGIETGVDLNRVINCAWMLEEMLGRLTPGHVSKAGPCPISPEDWYDPNMPFVESFEQARHFRLGSKVYADGHRPWKEAISRPRVA
ncbi:MAG: citramalate synthase [Deltaproteobacteria bacterium]|nr:citramalate synthase [Deltaproteobacteria bacterium]